MSMTCLISDAFLLFLNCLIVFYMVIIISDDGDINFWTFAMLGISSTFLIFVGFSIVIMWWAEWYVECWLDCWLPGKYCGSGVSVMLSMLFELCCDAALLLVVVVSLSHQLWPDRGRLPGEQSSGGQVTHILILIISTLLVLQCYSVTVSTILDVVLPRCFVFCKIFLWK